MRIPRAWADQPSLTCIANGTMTAFGTERDLPTTPTNVRSLGETGLNADIAFGPFLIQSGHGAMTPWMPKCPPLSFICRDALLESAVAPLKIVIGMELPASIPDNEVWRSATPDPSADPERDGACRLSTTVLNSGTLS
jgi:hypothetical protein